MVLGIYSKEGMIRFSNKGFLWGCYLKKRNLNIDYI